MYVKVDGSNATNFGGTSFRIVNNYLFNSEGTLNSPLDLGDAEIFDYHATVGNTTNSYFQVNLNADTAYEIALGSLSNFAYTDIFSNADFSTGFLCSTSVGGTSCKYITGGTDETVYLLVHKQSPYGAQFRIDITQRIYEAQGSVASPVNLGGLPVQSFISEVNNENSYYQVTLDANTRYAISISNLLDDADLYVYSDAGFTTEICSSVETGLVIETCVMPISPTPQTVYIRVNGQNALSGGADYQFSVAEYFTSEGAEGSEIPLLIDADPVYRGTVGVEGEYSYYKVNAAAYSAYTFRLDNYSSYVRAQMSEDPTFTNNLRWIYPNQDNDIYTIDTATVYYLRVPGVSPNGAAYDISVATHVFDNFGTSINPFDLFSAPQYQFYSEVDTTASYYKLHVIPGENYTSKLVVNYDNADLYVYSDSGFTTLACSSTNTGLASDTCSFTAPGSGYAYIKIDGSPILASVYDYNGTSFNLSVLRELNSEGSVGSPQVLPDGVGKGTIGTVASGGISYYQVSGLNAGTQYLIKAYGARNETINLRAYDNADFATAPLCGYGEPAPDHFDAA